MTAGLGCAQNDSHPDYLDDVLGGSRDKIVMQDWHEWLIVQEVLQENMPSAVKLKPTGVKRLRRSLLP
jgi:hypothetical protein